MPTTTRVVVLGSALVLLSGGVPRAAQSRQPPTMRMPSALVARPGIAMPAGARIEYDPHSCVDNRIPCPNGANPLYVQPSASGPFYFVWNVAPVPGAGAVSWQVLYTPFLPGTFAATPSPQGAVVRSGVQAGKEDEFQIDLVGLARSLHMTPVEPPSSHTLHLPPPKPAPSRSTAGARLAPMARGGVRLPDSHLYVRVVPVRSASDQTPVGRPSDAIAIIYGDPPALHFKEPPVYSTPAPAIAIVNFKWVPWVRIDNWPGGCEGIPRDTGTGGLDVVGETLLDIWNWASTAYGDIQNAVVNVAHLILPMIPKEVLSGALQIAMVAAGLPPSIPNLDQLMNDGAGYLAESVASQIPVPASNELAGMTVEAFKTKARDAAKQAIMAGAAEARKALSGSGIKYCQQWESWPLVEITVRNTGHDDYTDVPIRVTDSANLFKNLSFRLPAIRAGQSLTVPVVLIDRTRMNVQVTEHSELPEYDDEKAEGNWWDDALKRPTAFTISPPGDFTCSDATLSDCWPSYNAGGFTSAKKVWLPEGYVHKSHAS